MNVDERMSRDLEEALDRAGLVVGTADRPGVLKIHADLRRAAILIRDHLDGRIPLDSAG